MSTLHVKAPTMIADDGTRSEQPVFNLSHIAILDRGKFTESWRANRALATSGSFILNELFGPKESSFKRSIIWSANCLFAGEHDVDIFSPVHPKKLEVRELTKDVALSILYSYDEEGANGPKSKVCHRPLHLEGDLSKPLVLQTLVGKHIFIDKGQVRVSNRGLGL